MSQDRLKNVLLYLGFCTGVTFFPSGMNFSKYSAQNDACSFDYSTSVRLIKTDTDKAFQFLYFLPTVLLTYAAVIIVHYNYSRQEI